MNELLKSHTVDTRGLFSAVATEQNPLRLVRMARVLETRAWYLIGQALDRIEREELWRSERPDLSFHQWLECVFETSAMTMVRRLVYYRWMHQHVPQATHIPSFSVMGSITRNTQAALLAQDELFYRGGVGGHKCVKMLLRHYNGERPLVTSKTGDHLLSSLKDVDRRPLPRCKRCGSEAIPWYLLCGYHAEGV